MINLQHALIRIDDAATERPFCPCGEPTVVVADGDRIWLTCPAAQASGGILRRLFSLDAAGPHIRRLLLDFRQPDAIAS
jgi:hypothetical protein